jgi:sugar lactone lactonase YvrE
VAVDGAGNLYVADTGNHVIRVVTAAGVSSTLAGTVGVKGSADGLGANASFNQPWGIALDSAGNLYVSDYGSSTIRKVTQAGQVTTLAGTAGAVGSVNNTGANARFFHPMGLAVDSATNIYVADYGNHLIRKITPPNVVSTLAGTAGEFGSADGPNGLFYEPESVAVDQAGNVYVADTGNGAIRMITSNGSISTLAG